MDGAALRTGQRSDIAVCSSSVSHRVAAPYWNNLAVAHAGACWKKINVWKTVKYRSHTFVPLEVEAGYWSL